MRKREILLCLAASLFGLSAATQAQVVVPAPVVVAQAARPLEFAAANCQLDGQRLRCTCQLTNTSGREIGALSVKWEFKYSNGHVGGAQTTDDPLFPTGHGPIRSGEQIEPGPIRAPLYAYADLVSISVALEFVEFADGTVWGNAESSELAEIRSVRHGARALYEALRGIYQTGGLAALLKKLNLQ